MQAIQRIHHITAIVGPPQENYDFYHGILELKLIKQTVNFDNKGMYHLYYANRHMDLGTVLTFFPIMSHRQSFKGSGQVGRIAFSVPKGSLRTWANKLAEHQVEYNESLVFGQMSLNFADFHGLRLALVESETSSDNHEILGFHGVELASAKPELSYEELTEGLGLLDAGISDQDHYHLVTAGEERHHIVIPKIPQRRGHDGVGTVHHIAWSVPDMAELEAVYEFYKQDERNITQVKDRKYFQSVYVREIGHVLFEFATDEPGFAIDEDLDSIGQKLMLPPQYEAERANIEANLPDFQI